ncbi:MMPL family transporter [Hyphococcus flavus]|uniref:MMPL family transporter n=1 Tax=Hyphococcus flavus TaxID=1866326 RepID=A0AAE9ZBD6_9PROT|nr:MMPL family transporter [Hyphococcus flavus]WDI30916.1 MMPL family transporter [Hyphococcus flavus]
MLKFIETLLGTLAEGSRRAGAPFAASVLFLAILAGAYAATNLKVNTDTSAMLDPALPFQQRAAELRDAFPEMKEDVIVVIRAPSLDEADAYAAALRDKLASHDDFTSVFAPAQEPFFRENGLLYLSVDELEGRLSQMSQAAGLIETLIESPTVGTLFTTMADNDRLAERSDLGQETLQRIYAELGDVVEASLAGQQRPFSWMGAIDEEMAEKEAHTRLLYATPVLDYTRLQPAKGAINALRAETLEMNTRFGGRVQTYITGDPSLRLEELEAVTTGIGYSFLLSFILVSLLLLLCYRSIGMAVLTLLGLIVTLTFTSAFAAAFMGELNLVSVAFTVLLVGLGLDFAIHLFLHIQERRAAGQDNREALKGALHEVGPALALAGPTTALAFLSFVPTKFDGIAQLGMIAAVGVIIALLVTMTYGPSALALFKSRPQQTANGRVRKVFDSISKVSGPVAIATIALGVVALFLMPQVRFDADQMALRNPNAQSVVGFNLLFEDPQTLPYRLSRLVDSEDAAVETASAASALETVAAVRSLPDFVPDAQDEKLELIDFGAGGIVLALDAAPGSVEGPPAADGIRALQGRLDEAYEDGAGARLAALLTEIDTSNEAQVAYLQENIFAYWPQLVSLLRAQMNADYVDIDTLPETLKSRYLSDDGKWRVDIMPKGDVRDFKELDKFVDEVEAVIPDLAGGAYQARKAGETISQAMLQATGIAFGIISVFLWLLVRRLRTVLLMLFPLALAAVLTAATGVILNIPFNYANVIVLPLLIGIGVDSGIHLVMRQRQIAAGEGIYGTSTPRAVLFAALTTVASFGSLMLSPHRGTASMGELLSIAILFTLICTLIVLPAAFNYEEKRASKGL